ncbi:MAG TPA: DUF503 domain-containing protein [Thermomicrobiales bacterium]|jgi:uncharacterized protein YlxP (DUF503 family)|nr:DUF503 domain-containing protein [Thermomicrobiales bacterium]
MATVVGVAHVTLYLEASFSLKDKRHVVRSLTQRLRNQFNLAVAEVEDLDDIRVATLALVCVSNSSPHADEMLAHAISFVERNVELGSLGDVHTELIHVD